MFKKNPAEAGNKSTEFSTLSLQRITQAATSITSDIGGNPNFFNARI